MKKLLKSGVFLGLMSVALLASSESPEDLRGSVRRWFDTATQVSKLKMVEKYQPEFKMVSRQLLPVKKTSEEVQDILGCLAVEYVLRLSQGDKQGRDVQNIYQLFGDASILNNKDLSLLLGRLCQSDETSNFNLNDSLSIARLIHACEPRIVNGLGFDDMSSVASSIRINEPQLEEFDGEDTPSQRRELISYCLCEPNRFVKEALDNECFDMCKFLINRGANINFKVTKDGKTCLYQAMQNDDVPSFALLYNTGLRHAVYGQPLAQTVNDYRCYCSKIYQHCLDNNIIQKAQQVAAQEEL